MKLNRLYEVGTNNTTNIEKLIKRLATKNIKKGQRNEWQKFSNFNKVRFERELK